MRKLSFAAALCLGVCAPPGARSASITTITNCLTGVGTCTSVALTAQSSAVAVTPLLAAASVATGFYQVEGYLVTSAACTSGTGAAWVDVTYSDGTQSALEEFGSVSLAVVGSRVRFSVPFQAGAGTAISYSVSMNACPGGAYNVSVVLVRVV